jgi:hypothetical protein
VVAATEYATVPAPVTEAPPVTVIQGALLVAAQVQVERLGVTVKLAVEPAAPGEAEVTLSA